VDLHAVAIEWITNRENSMDGNAISIPNDSLVRPVFLWHNLLKSNPKGVDGNE